MNDAERRLALFPLDARPAFLRPIYRDVDALRVPGISIYSVQGSRGGYRLLDGYRVRLNGLSTREAEALSLAGLTRQAADLGMAAVAASARAKLLAALPGHAIRCDESTFLL